MLIRRMEEEESAAIKIQALQRGRIVRKQGTLDRLKAARSAEIVEKQQLRSNTPPEQAILVLLLPPNPF